MEDKVYNIEYIKVLLNPVFESYDVKRAIIFGSYGKGTANEYSDIDLFVESDLKGLKFLGLLEAIKSRLKKEVDLFDKTHIDENSVIDKEIKETGVLIYEKRNNNIEND